MPLLKLLLTLEKLNGTNLARLRDYLHSPYFKITPSAVSLFDYLYKLPRPFSSTDLRVERIGASNTLLSSASKQSQAGTHLLSAIVDFIGEDEWRQNKREKVISTIIGLKKHHLFKHAEVVLKKAKSTGNTLSEVNVDNLYLRHRLIEIEQNGYDAKIKRNPHDHINKIVTSLDEFYAVKKIRYTCEAINRKEWIGTTYEVEETKVLIQKIEDYVSEETPYIYLFVHIFKMQTAKDFKTAVGCYQKIKVHIERSKGKLNEGVVEAIPYVVNFCLLWNNRGVISLGKDYIEWIKFLIRHKLLLNNGKIQPVVFRNVVGIAAKCGVNFNWIKEFIEQHRLKLPVEQRDNNMAYAWGIYFFYNRDFDQAAINFHKIKAASEPILNCIQRRWYFMSEYEVRDSKYGLYELLGAWEKYIQRNARAIHQFKTAFNQFIYYSKKLLTAKDKVERKKLHQRLSQEQFFPGKDWLIEKIRA